MANQVVRGTFALLKVETLFGASILTPSSTNGSSLGSVLTDLFLDFGEGSDDGVDILISLFGSHFG